MTEEDKPQYSFHKAADDLFDCSERLGLIDEYRLLDDLSKRIILRYAQDPTLTKDELARKLGLAKKPVYELFHSKAFEKIVDQIAHQELSELLLPAARKLRQLLADGSSKVQLDTAIAILEDKNVLKASPRSVKTDNKMVVFWGEDKDKKLLGQVIHGDKNSLFSTSEAAGGPRIDGQV